MSLQPVYSNRPPSSQSTPNLARLSSSASTPVIAVRTGNEGAPKRKPPPPVTQSIIRQAGSFAVISSAGQQASFSLPPPIAHSTLKLSKLFLPPPDESSSVAIASKRIEDAPTVSTAAQREEDGELKKPDPPFGRVPPSTHSTQLRWDSALLDIENALR